MRPSFSLLLLPRLASFTVAAALVAGGCASKKEEDPYPTTDAFCAARAAAECLKAADACLATKADCEGARKQRCMAEAGALVSPVRQYNPANAQACLDAIKLAYDDGKLTVAEESTSAASSMGAKCARVLDGTAARNAACGTDFDCAAGLVCGRSRVTNELRCVLRVDKKKGDECANAGDTCEAGAYCSARAVCDPVKGGNEPCSDGEPCGERLRCDPVAKKCVDRSGIGQGCQSHGDCLPEAPYCLALQVGSQCAKDLTLAPGVPACKDYGK